MIDYGKFEKSLKHLERYKIKVDSIHDKHIRRTANSTYIGSFIIDMPESLTSDRFRAIASIEIGGLNEKNVPSVLGDTTKAKTDCVIVIGEKTRNISLKNGKGQVYLITLDRFTK